MYTSADLNGTHVLCRTCLSMCRKRLIHLGYVHRKTLSILNVEKKNHTWIVFLYWIRLPCSRIRVWTRLFHWSMAGRMLSCDTRGHVHAFWILFCSNSRDWKVSVWFLSTDCFISFQTWSSKGNKCGEIYTHSVDLKMLFAAASYIFKPVNMNF
jgi:hypothetical protein